MSATTTQAEPDDPAAMDIDTLASLISCERRRIIVEHVSGLDDGAVTTTSELSELIAEIEAGPEWTHDDRKRVYVALSQLHLRKLNDAEVLIQVGRNRFTAGPRADRVREGIAVLAEVCEG